jgi:hypothetical protein
VKETLVLDNVLQVTNPNYPNGQAVDGHPQGKVTMSLPCGYTGDLKAEKDKKNTPSPNLLFFQKISDSACNEP